MMLNGCPTAIEKVCQNTKKLNEVRKCLKKNDYQHTHYIDETVPVTFSGHSAFRPVQAYNYTREGLSVTERQVVPSTSEVSRVTLAAFLLPAGKLSPILSNFSLRERPPFFDLALENITGTQSECTIWKIFTFLAHSENSQRKYYIFYVAS